MGPPVPIPQHTPSADHLRQHLSSDFSHAYVAVNELLLSAERRPASISADALNALIELLADNGRFAKARQRYFLYKQTAHTLATVYAAPKAPPSLAALAHNGLRRVLMTAQGDGLRAAADALGGLPVAIPCPTPPEFVPSAGAGLPQADCRTLLTGAAIDNAGSPYLMGRTLILPSARGDVLVAVKLARRESDLPNLYREAFWLVQLQNRRAGISTAAHIPQLLKVKGGPLFRLKAPPIALDNGGPIHPDRVAIAYKARSGYFNYPNDDRPQHRPDGDQLRSMMARNAHQMGTLAAQGILHSAPIPLFHNRIQRHRRDDAGRYQWYRAGRLDRWLTSCRFPNMGADGLRDFEHLEVHCGSSKRLFREIGTQFLSFLLVIGSYFRSAAPGRVGLGPGGRTVDARDLFDRKLLERLIRVIFSSYYRGFTGEAHAPVLRADLPQLCERMVAEMGQDRHMVEILRAVDQMEMDDISFATFLREGGMPAEEIARRKRGVADIELLSGPHLGNFNRQISLPELTDAVGVMAALCMDGRHRIDGATPSP